MKKRVFSLFLALVVTFSMVCPLVFADDSSTHVHNWTSGVISEFSDTVEGIPVSVSVKKCTECNFYKHTYKFFGLSFDFYSVTAYTGIVDDFLLDVSLHIMNALGKNATAKKYETGGGSAGTGGVGRNPSGYVNSNKGIPSVSSDGSYTIEAKYYVSNTRNITFTGTFVPPEWSKNGDDYDFTATADGITFENRSGNNNLQVPFYGSYWVDVSTLKGGHVYIPKGSLIRNEGNYVKATEDSVWREAALTVGTMSFNDNDKVLNFFYKGLFYSYSSPTTFHGNNQSVSYVVMKSDKKYSFDYPVLYLRYVPYDGALKNQTNITINNNTWNGNIYQDNSTNLTYIYPQYTTINNEGDTITNISNNPIIYNNETKQYYTYDTVTNNYYYITYETPTPSPSPDPGTDPTPTPEPGEDTGDTSGIMKILQEIKAVLVSGFAGITEKLQNIGVGGSTPESGKPGSSSGGQSWWDKLLGKIGDAIVDGLLGAISAVLKLIFKLFTTILGWIIWLVSQVLTLFPFLPPGLGALLIGGVVVCFIIGLIKFIRG